MRGFDANEEQTTFERAVAELQVQASNFGAHMTVDSRTRQAYQRNISAMANDLRSRAKTNLLTWRQAAEQAQALRNVIMNEMRTTSTSVGRAYAESLKREGKTLNELIAKKVVKLFGPQANFNTLSALQRDAIYAEIVESSARSRPSVDALIQKMSYAGRGLLFMTLAISVYNVSTADNKTAAAAHEVGMTSASILGGIAGGALAGLACGPGAPVCVGLGAFVGGTLAALGFNAMW